MGFLLNRSVILKALSFAPHEAILSTAFEQHEIIGSRWTANLLIICGRMECSFETLPFIATRCLLWR